MFVDKKYCNLGEVFVEDVFAEYSISELQEEIGTGSYSWTYNLVQEAQEKGLIEIRERSFASMCGIDLESPTSISFLAALEEERAAESDIPHREKIYDMIPGRLFTLIITGSYADGTYTSDSDLDVVVLVPDKELSEKTLNILKGRGETMSPELHPYVFTYTEFVKMLLSEKENYGKEIFRNHLIISGAEQFYRAVSEAAKDGFRG